MPTMGTAHAATGSPSVALEKHRPIPVKAGSECERSMARPSVEEHASLEKRRVDDHLSPTASGDSDETAFYSVADDSSTRNVASSYGNGRQSFVGSGRTKVSRAGAEREAKAENRAQQTIAKAMPPETLDGKIGRGQIGSDDCISDELCTLLLRALERSGFADDVGFTDLQPDILVALKKQTSGLERSLESTFEFVLAYMDTYMEDENVLRRGFELLSVLICENEKTVNGMGKLDLVEGVVLVMSECKSSAVVQERAVELILQMTNLCSLRPSIVTFKGAECVCWSMKEFQRNRVIQTYGSMALCNLAFGSTENKKRIGKIGGIDSVIKAMDAHMNDPILQARGCLALRNLTCGVRVNQWIAGRAFAMEAVIRAMNRFQTEWDVQYQGTAALENLCSLEPDNRSRAIEIGVVPAALNAMRVDVVNKSLVEHGLSLLRTLCQGSEKMQACVGEHDGVSVVLDTIREHMSSASVLERAATTLRYLMFQKENRVSIQQCGGLEVLVRVLREGMKSRSVAESAIYAVGNAVFDISEHKRALGRYGGMSAIVDLMTRYIDCLSIQEHGCRALRNLADCDDLNMRLLADSGAIDAGIFAMMAYPENPNVQEQGSALLLNMVASEANTRRMLGMDLERVLEQAREHHPDCKVLLEQVSALELRLGHSPDRQERNHREGSLRGNRIGSIVSLSQLSKKPSLRDKSRKPKGAVEAVRAHKNLDRIRSFDLTRKGSSSAPAGEGSPNNQP